MGRFFTSIKEDKFKGFAFIFCIFLFISLSVDHYRKANSMEAGRASYSPDKFVIFYSPTCPHCHDALEFIDNKLSKKYPEIDFMPVNGEKQFDMFMRYKHELGFGNFAVPRVAFNGETLLGFNNSMKAKYRDMIESYLDPETGKKKAEKINESDVIDLPILGQVNLANQSLPWLTVILGLVDGFNPCAMWVLVFMISIIAGLNDKKKIWFIVGSFVFASGVLYYLFMTIWFKAFEYFGYIYYVQALVGVTALYIGLLMLRDYWQNKVECEVGDLASKQRTRDKIKALIAKPLNIATFFGIIALAFTVNAIEFACSSVIPVVYNNILAASDLVQGVKYLYILGYVFFFMLDDLIIFSLAAFAVNKFVGTKYVKYSKLIGGFVLFMLGILIAFFPEMLW